PTSTLFPYTTLFRSGLQYQTCAHQVNRKSNFLCDICETAAPLTQLLESIPWTDNRKVLARAALRANGGTIADGCRRSELRHGFRSEEHTSELQSRSD